MNGVRRESDEIINVISNGGKLLSAELVDNTGSHGDYSNTYRYCGNVLSFVMSCRVFQRKVENAFLYAVVNSLNIELKFKWNVTQRNEPFKKFIQEIFPKKLSKKFTIKKDELKNIYSPKSKLFEFSGLF